MKSLLAKPLQIIYLSQDYVDTRQASGIFFSLEKKSENETYLCFISTTGYQLEVVSLSARGS